MPIDFILFLFDEGRCLIRKLFSSQRAHEGGLIGWDISKVMSIVGNNLYRLRVKLIVGLRHQGTIHAPDIPIDTLAAVDTRNLQYSQVLEDGEPTAIVTTFGQSSIRI